MFKIILLWRILLFVVAIFAPVFITSFGGRFPYSETYLIPSGLPQWIWGFANFDGVHYLAIADHSYKDGLVQAFFPIYPLLIRLGSFWSDSLATPIIVGLLISNLAFFVTCWLLPKLWSPEYSTETIKKSLIFILAFPTAFYFVGLYSEGLYFLLVVLTFLLVKRKQFLAAGIVAAIASGTRMTGILLEFVILIEVIRAFRNGQLTKEMILSLVIAPIGLLGYMFYLFQQFANPLLFITAPSGFGTGRSQLPVILLPQVIFRYLKIFLSVKVNSLAFFNAVSEFILSIGALTTLFILLRDKIFRTKELGLWLFVFLTIFIPTMTGTFTSMPRYLLIGLIIAPAIVSRISKLYWPIIILMDILQMIFLALFIQGYWVA